MAGGRGEILRDDEIFWGILRGLILRRKNFPQRSFLKKKFFIEYEPDLPALLEKQSVIK